MYDRAITVRNRARFHGNRTILTLATDTEGRYSRNLDFRGAAARELVRDTGATLLLLTYYYGG